jgi:hypothetical protein
MLTAAVEAAQVLLGLMLPLRAMLALLAVQDRHLP